MSHTPTTGPASEAEIAELRAAAEKATQGDYRTSAGTPSRVDTENGSISISWFDNTRDNPHVKAEEQAHFIALANPARVLSLLDQLAEARDQVADLSAEVRETDTFVSMLADERKAAIVRAEAAEQALTTSQEREAALVAGLEEIAEWADQAINGNGGFVTIRRCEDISDAVRALLPKASAPKEGETL